MAEPSEPALSPTGMPHFGAHRHSDVSGGWLRAATFGAMDGLVSNTALIAGVAAAASAHTVVISGVAGLLAGAFSMALGEYTSVTTSNEQIDSEVQVERRSFERHPKTERAELVAMLVTLGMTRETAAQATDEIHRDENKAVNFHLAQELGVNPSEKPSPWVAAISSFVMFAIGAIVPLIPYLLGFDSLWAGVICGGVGLSIAGGVAARFTSRPIWWASLRQLLFGGVAIAATYLVGTLVDSILRARSAAGADEMTTRQREHTSRRLGYLTEGFGAAASSRSARITRTASSSVCRSASSSRSKYGSIAARRSTRTCRNMSTPVPVMRISTARASSGSTVRDTSPAFSNRRTCIVIVGCEQWSSAARSQMRDAPLSSIVASRRACAKGNGIRARCDARRLSRATAASRSAPRPWVTDP